MLVSMPMAGRRPICSSGCSGPLPKRRGRRFQLRKAVVNTERNLLTRAPGMGKWLSTAGSRRCACLPAGIAELARQWPALRRDALAACGGIQRRDRYDGP